MGIKMRNSTHDDRDDRDLRILADNIWIKQCHDEIERMVADAGWRHIFLGICLAILAAVIMP